MNAREKGKRGERWWRDELRANGYAARRGQQFSGSPDSPDVICEELSWIHFEVKFVERLNIEDAMDQARRDSRTEKAPMLVHKKNHRRGLVTMDVETLFRLLRGDFPQPRIHPDQQGFSAESAAQSEGKAEIRAATKNGTVKTTNRSAVAHRPTDSVEPLRGNTSPIEENQNLGRGWNASLPTEKQETKN